jgi:hypothetical protein
MKKTATYPRKAILTLIAGAAGAVFCVAPFTALAAPAPGTQSFQVSPPTANYSGNRGTAVAGTIQVTNLTKQALTVNVGKENFVAQGEEGQVELVNNADPLYSLSPWFYVDQNQMSIPGLGTAKLHYTIGIPANAEPGGRYGSITFSTIPPALNGGSSGASIMQTLGSLVFLRINGAAKEQLNVLTFQTTSGTTTSAKKDFFEYGPVNFITRIKNNGNVHERPTGTITIKNMLGITTATLSLDQHYVIPTAIRRWYNTLGTSQFNPLLFGPYTATLNASYAGNKTITATTSFTVFPYKLVIIALVILLVLFLLIFKGRKRFARAFRILAGKE